MGTSFDSALLAALGLAIVAGLVAVALAILSISLLRRALGRLVGHLRELRRHSLVGLVPQESEPALVTLTLELNGLIEDLRSRLHDYQKRGEDLAGLAAGPPDLALIGADADWGVTFFSRGAVQMLGWATEEITGRHVESLFADREWERLLPKLSRRSLRESGLSESVRLRRRDGTDFPAQLSVAHAAGGGAEVLLAARDRTVEQASQDDLRDSEERYRLLVEGTGDGVFILQDDVLVYLNETLSRMIGSDRQTLTGASPARLFHPHDLLRVIETLRRAMTAGEPGGETRCLLSSAGPRPAEVRLAWTRTEYRKRPALIGTLTDVSRRGRYERALAASEARLQATLESTGDGILALEDLGRGQEVTLANRAFCDLWGLAPEDLLGRARAEVVTRLAGLCAEPEALGSFFNDAAGGVETGAEGIEIAGRGIHVDLRSSRVVAPAGERTGMIVTARDITRRLNGERDLRRSLDELSRAQQGLESANRVLAATQAELAERNEQLVRLNTELRSLDEMKSNLLANVSHELHTPLVSIKGYTEMVLKRRLGPLTPEQERGLGVALKNIDRLIEMIDNLLSFSRLEKGETQLRLEDVPLWQVVDEAVEMVGERIRKKNLSVTTEYETDELVVRGDRARIGQVVVNLLTNAVKFNRDGGRITLTARKGPKGFLDVEVADTGIGIKEQDLGRIFERFYQGDATSRRRYEGTGIGLSIVRDILRLHGCTIRVKSEVDKGSVFSFTLPLSHQQSPAPRPAHGRDRGHDRSTD